MTQVTPVSQGTLNRLLTNATFPNYPSLNCTASYMGKQAIRITFNSAATTQLPTMTGAVQSPEPYRAVTLTINLLKTQGTSGIWLAQEQLNTLLGPVTLYLDSAVLPSIPLFNAAIEGIQDLTGSGADADYMVRVNAFMVVNAALYQ